DMSGIDPIASAIHEWRQALGDDKVSAEAASLDEYARTTMVRGTRPCCILWPTTTGEVQEIVRVASKHGVVVYPLSRGKNWGYGDACAPTNGAAVVNLSRMNRILEVNTDLAYAVIEPGVSQQQLYRYLQEHKTGLWMDATGAGLDASLVGNTLERGFGHTRNGDHFSTTSGMEVVLADG
ncbi:MAG: FAD-dependent oxidoreductase, partial [bacterium]|nr:FAD-dependent oxidoreductase [bacterium]